jgi:ssDNA-binding Zn-finger/Zn-ribbon topoisomerase 1
MAGKAKRELSTAWWNVIRRQMRATTAKEDPSVQCPDCNGRMHLKEGRYGRFYKCNRYECKGTLGAHLDGKPRPDKASPSLRTARKRARVAIGMMFHERDKLHQEEHPDDLVEWGYPTWCSCGKEWRSYTRPKEGDAKPDLENVIVVAELLANVRFSFKSFLGDHRVYDVAGIHLKRRTVEECRRIEAAAKARTQWLIEELKLLRHRRRGNAWDRVYVGSFDELVEVAHPAETLPRLPEATV